MTVWKRVPRRVTSVLSHCPPLSLFFAPPSLFSPTLVSADGRRVGGRVSASTSFVIHFYFLRAKLSFLLCIVYRFHGDMATPRSFRGLEFRNFAQSRIRVNERVHGTFPSNRFPTIVFSFDVFFIFDVNTTLSRN